MSDDTTGKKRKNIWGMKPSTFALCTAVCLILERVNDTIRLLVGR